TSPYTPPSRTFSPTLSLHDALPISATGTIEFGSVRGRNPKTHSLTVATRRSSSSRQGARRTPEQLPHIRACPQMSGVCPSHAECTLWGDGGVQTHHGQDRAHVDLPTCAVGLPPGLLEKGTQCVVGLGCPHVHRGKAVLDQMIHARVHQTAAVTLPGAFGIHVQREDLGVRGRPQVRITRGSQSRETG